MRANNRLYNQLRHIEFDLKALKNGEGACLIKFGNTHVACTASIEEKVPYFLKGKGSGWVTAEYGMLPRSTTTRMQREAQKGGMGGRTQEIQRLIGRALRAVIDLKLLGERQIFIDCDVINADGGTRTAAITGSYIALYQACLKLLNRKSVRKMPIHSMVAAISCGIIDKQYCLDLDYTEDSNAQVDANFVLAMREKVIKEKENTNVMREAMMRGGLIEEEEISVIEVQATAEKDFFSKQDFNKMLVLAEIGIKELFDLQKQTLTIIKSEFIA